MGGYHHIWDASPAELIVSTRMLLSSSIPKTLQRRRLFYPSILCLTTLAVFLSNASYILGTVVTVTSEGVVLQFKRPVPWMIFVASVSWLTLVAMLAHGMNRQVLLLSCRQFDSLVISLCLSLASIAHVINRILSLSSADYDFWWFCSDVATNISICAVSVVLGNIDSCMFPSKVLIAILAMGLAQSSYQWFANRCLNSEWREPAYCGSEKKLMGFVSREFNTALYAQVAVFIGKGMWARFRGRTFGFIHSQYVQRERSSCSSSSVSASATHSRISCPSPANSVPVSIGINVDDSSVLDSSRAFPGSHSSEGDLARSLPTNSMNTPTCRAAFSRRFSL